MVSTEMSHKFLERLEAHRTEAAIVPTSTLRRIYHVPMHGAEVLQQMGLLLEHGYTKATRERFLSSMNTQVRLQVPRHPELLAAVLASIFSQVRHVAARRTAPVTAARTSTDTIASTQTVHQTVLGQARSAVLTLEKVRIRWQCTQDRSSARQRKSVWRPRVDKGCRILQRRRSSTVRTRRPSSTVMCQVVVVRTQVVVIVMWVVVVVQKQIGGLPGRR